MNQCVNILIAHFSERLDNTKTLYLKSEVVNNLRENNTGSDEVSERWVGVPVDGLHEVDRDVAHFRVVVARFQQILKFLGPCQ